MAKAATWTGIDAEARTRGEQTGLDTPVVSYVYGWLQWGILHNGGNPDAATPRE